MLVPRDRGAWIPLIPVALGRICGRPSTSLESSYSSFIVTGCVWFSLSLRSSSRIERRGEGPVIPPVTFPLVFDDGTSSMVVRGYSFAPLPYLSMVSFWMSRLIDVNELSYETLTPACGPAVLVSRTIWLRVLFGSTGGRCLVTPTLPFFSMEPPVELRSKLSCCCLYFEDESTAVEAWLGAGNVWLRF